MLKNVEDCYRDGDSLRNLFVRPNQVFLTNANRTDVFFKAPLDAAGKVYTVFAQEFPLGDRQLPAAPADRPSPAAGPGSRAGNPAPVDVVVGYIKVSGEPVPGGDFDVMSLRDKLPPVPPFLQPVRGRRAARAGRGSDAPRRAGGQLPDARDQLFRLRADGFSADRSARRRSPAASRAERAGCGTRSTAPACCCRRSRARWRSTASSTSRAIPNPPAPQKFGHHDPHHPQVLVNTSRGVGALQLLDLALEPHGHRASSSSRASTACTTVRIRSAARTGRRASRAIPSSRSRPRAPIIRSTFTSTRAGSRASTCRTSRAGCTTSSMRRSGWTRSRSRAGGRVVFRSRFADYIGTWVNHCHILMHEDHGMMQAVEIGAARGRRQLSAADARRVPCDAERRGERDLPAAVARADVPAEHDVRRCRARSSARCFRGFRWTCRRWSRTRRRRGRDYDG